MPTRNARLALTVPATLPAAPSVMVHTVTAGVLSSAYVATDDLGGPGGSAMTGPEIAAALFDEDDINNFDDAAVAKLAGLVEHFLGVYVSLGALQTAHPTAVAGDYADVDTGPGDDVARYIWDVDDTAWVLQAGGGTVMTGAEIATALFAEGDTNNFDDAAVAKLAGLTEHFRGVYASLGALQTAHPTGAAGDYGDVDAGASSNVQRYIWDPSDNAWVLQSGSGGVTNLSTTTGASTLTVVSSSGTNAVLPAATPTVAGVLTAADKAKLDSQVPLDEPAERSLVAWLTGVDETAYVPVSNGVEIEAGGTVQLDDLARTSIVTLPLFRADEDVVVGDGAGDIYWRVPPLLDGYTLIAVAAYHVVAGDGAGGESTTIQIHNVTDAANILSTPLSIDEDETDSEDAASAAVIATAALTGRDVYRIDVDTVVGLTGTLPKGLCVDLTVLRPTA